MSKTVIMATWDDVPHLDAAAKASLLESYPEYQRKARSKGIPMLGSGAIYPIAEEDVRFDPFEPPAHWPRGYGLDVGWKCTCAAFGAHDRDTDVIWIYDLHYRGAAEPDVHAAAIKRRGEWLTGAIDPASRGRSQKDGERLISAYNENGLKLVKAVNAVEAGIFEVYQRLGTGRLRVAAHLHNFWTEYRLYRRDEKGNVVKQLDHAMDAVRYLVMTAPAIMMLRPNYLQRAAPGAAEANDFDPYRGDV